MKSIMVDLQLFANIGNFVATTNTINSDVFAVSGKYKINAKSIMGLYSLDLSKPVEIVFDESVTDEEIKRFDAFIAK